MLQHLLRVERPNYEASRSVGPQGLVRNHGVAHVKVLLQHLSNIGVADADAVLAFDGPSDLRSSPDACLFLLANSVNN